MPVAITTVLRILPGQQHSQCGGSRRACLISGLWYQLWWNCILRTNSDRFVSVLQRSQEEIGSPVFGWRSWGCPTASVSQCWQLWPWYGASLSCRAGLQQRAGSSPGGMYVWVRALEQCSPSALGIVCGAESAASVSLHLSINLTPAHGTNTAPPTIC